MVCGREVDRMVEMELYWHRHDRLRVFKCVRVSGGIVWLCFYIMF